MGLLAIQTTIRPDPLGSITEPDATKIFAGLLKQSIATHMENIKRSLRVVCELEARCAVMDGGLASILQELVDVVGEYQLKFQPSDGRLHD
jgi:hypothetical protein